MEGSGSSLDRIRRLRGVSWQWRPEAPIERDGREAGVIAQDVQAVFPDLVERAPEGYLRVDYGSLVQELRKALLELNDRMENLGPDADARAGDAKDPVEAALVNLRSGELRPIDHTALVGTLVEAVKELDRRLAEIERRQGAEGDGC